MLNDLLRNLRVAAANNIGLKLVSLVAALVLYSMAHGAQDAQRTVSPSVVALITPPETANRVLVTPLPATLRVTLRGPRSVVDDVRVANVVVEIRDGMSRVTFDPSVVKVPPGVTVEQVDPPAVDLVWENRVVRDVPVQVGVAGEPAAGYVIRSQPVAEPSVVRASGPESEVAVIQRVRTDAFDVAGLGEGKYTRTLAIERRPGGGVTYDATSVAVTLVIARQVSDRTFPRLPLSVIGTPKGRAQPPDVDVRVSCPPEVVRGLRAEQIVPRVHVPPGQEHGSDAFPVEVNVERCEVHATPESAVVRW